ncbi:MAG: type II toxin-antitoxin system prevent-host-death family antitoxin [Candidatus Obscuribacterales bacterium]|nr:type II toxin-antitoxin system prevent-host-death family antitoxin [Candidatus Obscuribacterales bacterium]
MQEIGAFDAKNKLSNLLDQVEAGAEIIITRRGQPVAKLVPARPVHNQEQARMAAERIRERAKQLKAGKFSWDEWKQYRDAGKK